MFFKKSKLKNVVVAYDTVTKQVLFFQREKCNRDGLSSYTLGRRANLDYKTNIKLESDFNFARFLELLEGISCLHSERFYCSYDLAYVFL